jgi:hypothetical protein
MGQDYYDRPHLPEKDVGGPDWPAEAEPQSYAEQVSSSFTSTIAAGREAIRRRQMRAAEIGRRHGVDADTIQSLIAGQAHAEEAAEREGRVKAFTRARRYFGALSGSMIPASAVAEFLSLLSAEAVEDGE